MSKKFAWRQGELDGLCGLYAWINAIYSIIKLDRHDCEKLFAVGIDYLHTHHWLRSTIYGGMSLYQVKILQNAFLPLVNNWGYNLICENICKDKKVITGIFAQINDWISNDYHSVIVGIDGNIHHWSCISKQFDDEIKFTDHGLKIEVIEFTAGKASPKKNYIVAPKNVLGVTIAKL